MAEAKETKNSGKILETGESSGKKPAIGGADISKEEENMDFVFTVKPIRTLHSAFQALADPKFNEPQRAVIQVGEAGCEITVWNFDVVTANECYGHLRLKAAGLEGYQCRNPQKKMFSWNGILNLFKAAERCEAESVKIYSVQGSNKLTFKWSPDASGFGFGQPFDINLRDVNSSFESFPNGLSYGFEAVLPSSVLRTMFEKMRRQPNHQQNNTVQVSLQPATVEVTAGSVLSWSGEYQDDEQEHKISMQWEYWEALECASRTADKCSVYLLINPGCGIMLRFHLYELGDLVFLNEAVFDQVPDELPFLGHFYRLNE